MNKEEIEIGEYIRTKGGFIRKVDEIDRCQECNEKIYISKENIEDLEFNHTYHFKNITKHSKNIIDLIEVGDIVCIKDSLYDNEYKSEVFEDYNDILCINNFEENEVIELSKNVENKQIELLSILTKEQYEQNCYKL